MISSFYLMLIIVGSVAKGETICSVCSCDDEIKQVPVLINCRERAIVKIFTSWELPDNLSQRKDLTYDLDLAYNQLEKIEVFTEFAVQEISFKKNIINQIPTGAFANLAYLSYLDLSHNSISVETFKSTQEIFKPREGETSLSLISLNLAYNQIASIPNDAFKYLEHLQQLNLEGNPLQVIDHQTVMALTSLRSLASLSLANTQISQLPGKFFGGMRRLTKLDLSFNLFEVVPEETENANYLTELRLDGNLMKRFSRNSFIGMYSLETLSISEMPNLAMIESGAFSSLPNLTNLIMNDNSLNSFIDPDAFDELKPESFKLKRFLMKNNSIRYLPHDLWPDFNLWNQILVIDLRYNPWVCDCHNEWMLTSLFKHIYDETQDLAKPLTCEHPAQFRGKRFSRIDYRLLPCNPRDNFNPYKRSFGLDSGKPTTSTFGTITMSLVIICLITLTTSAVVFTIFYIRRSRNARFSAIDNVRFNVGAQGMSFENSIYRDNPTTVPVTAE